MSELPVLLRRWQWHAAGLVVVVAFAVLAGRFWHPFYGFTRFVQLDEADARNGIHEIREHPVFVYAGFNGYDGAAYAQIAFHPLLDSTELQPALGNVPYRARRILGSALAWLLALGQPAWIANMYAALNLVVWLVLAALLWRVLPVNDARSFLAWLGVMFSAGALHSVRLALTDLLAATLVTAAIWAGERGRVKRGLAILAAAALARETALAAVVGFWRGPDLSSSNGPWRTRHAWTANIACALSAALPLAAWWCYVRWKAGPAAQGFGNFTWPLAGWIEKWSETFADFARHPEFTWLTMTTLLAVVALTVQAVFLLRVRRPMNPWWRVGMSGVAMMAVLGTSVWEGHPGAATRVLLPMGIAFAVFAIRTRAHVVWILGGNLTVFSGVLALWHVPNDPRELAAGRSMRGGYVACIESGWCGVERQGRAAWAWAANNGRLTVRTTVQAAGDARMKIKLRGFSDREIAIRSEGAVRWQGRIGERPQWIEVVAPLHDGEVRLEFHSDEHATRENANPDARALGFAVYGVALE